MGLQEALPGHKGEMFEVNSFVLSECILERIVPVIGVHPYPLNELLLLSAAVCRVQPKYIFEWGTNVGKSARLFYEIASCFGIQTEIHSIDLPPEADHIEHPHEKRGMLVRNLPGVILHEGDGLETSLQVVRQTGTDGPILFFVDGDHRYESVLRELDGIAGACPMASIAIHDTFMQTEASHYNIGPHLAVAAFLKARSGYQVIETLTGLPGTTLLYRA